MLIDKYILEFHFHEKHSLRINALPSDVFQTALHYQTDNDPIIRTAIAIREFPSKIIKLFEKKSPPAKPPFSMRNFTLLEQSDDHEVIFGLAGRLWQAAYGQASLQDTRDFLCFHEAGSVKLAFNFSVKIMANNQTRLTTETRVYCLDTKAKQKFTPYWYLIRPVSGLIRKKMLVSIRQVVT